MKLLKAISLGAIAFTLATGFGLGGNALKSSKKVKKGPVEISVPYAKYTKYFGYVDQNVKPEGKYKNKDAYYLYVWVPAAADEIGLSMISPAKGKAGKKDFKHSNFKAGMKSDKKAYFDTYLVLDRMAVVDPGKIKSAKKVLDTLAKNDDSSELPKNPGGSKYNSLLRHKSQLGNPTKAIVRGLYRITFTSFRGDVKGSYLATVGTNVPGLKIADSLEELHKIVNK
ncbi:MAG: hypothetical protein COA42_16830 [Alteromonadaceae bacterium]|nr:MAG: hypothetical protein COA42_16830 [Alteromonadaceae bacterium]